MAAVKKTKPLSIDELIEAQYALLSKSNNLSENQIKHAKDQIDKLEHIRKSLLVENIELIKNDRDTQFITKPKGDSKHVTLGDVREQIKTLDKTIKDNLVNNNGEPVNPGRKGLPKFNVYEGGQSEEPEKEYTKESDQERVDRLRKIGNVIDKKTAIQRAGARNEQLNTRNAAAYERFVSESRDRDKLLHDATEEQKKVFKQLEDVLVKLREAGSEDSEQLRQEIAKLAGSIEESPDNDTKKYMKPMMENIQRTASTGNRGNEGTLGDAWAALRGKKTVLNEGFHYDSRGMGSQIRNNSTNKFAAAAQAGMSRLSGAGSILGNLVLEKNEKQMEGMRHEGFQKFLDNFRPSTTDTGKKSGAPETGTRLENIAKLQGQQDELNRQREEFNNGPTAERKRPSLSVIEGGKGKKSAAASAKTGNATPGHLEAQVLNVTANVVNIKAARDAKAAAATPVSATSSPSATPAATPAAAWSGKTGEEGKVKEGQQAEAGKAEAGGGFGLGDALNLADAGKTALDWGKKGMSTIGSAGKGIAGRAGGMISGVGGALGKSGGMLSKAGGLAKGILGKAALPLAAGMAIYDGVTGYNKAGENLGIEGRDATFGEKMSSAGGSILSGLSFGLLDEKSTSKGIASLFGAGPDTKSTPGATATPAANVAKNALTAEQAAMHSRNEANIASIKERAGESYAAKTGSRDHAPQLNELSAENAANKSSSKSGPTIINNTTNATTGSKGDQPMMKGSARNEESSLARYTNRTASYW